MIVGCGIDLVENRRVEQELSRGPWLSSEGIFTPGEIRYCHCGMRPALRYAACFAVKEATLKAFGCGGSSLSQFAEVEFWPGRNGRQEVGLHRGLQAQARQLGVRISLSLARTRTHTAAMVVLEVSEASDRTGL